MPFPLLLRSSLNARKQLKVLSYLRVVCISIPVNDWVSQVVLPSRTLSSLSEAGSSPEDGSEHESGPRAAVYLEHKQYENLRVKPWAQRLSDAGEKFRLPRSVQAIYLRPLRRKPEHGLPVCDLQLRSYSVRNVEFFADFAVRVAYYLKLPVSGPVPLPRLVERWTVPRSNFVHKKSQENFERITIRRLIQIKDGHSETLQVWLSFLRKHAFYGVGMKANVWEFDSLNVGESMDVAAEDIREVLEPYLSHFGRHQDTRTMASSISDLLDSQRFSYNESPLSEAHKA